MGAAETLIELPYAPRRLLMPYHERTQRWAVIVAHRRAGKTVATINDLIRTALTLDRENPRCAYVAPLFKQAKDVAWEYLKMFTAPVPGRAVHESELRVDFPNGGRVRLYGADNPDGMRGIYLDDCVLDEFADMRPRFLPEVIRPALSDRKGRLTIIGTPRGHNDFYDAWARAGDDPAWFRMMLRASETGLVDAEELALAARMMSEAQYQQEYECSFTAAIIGAYYGALMEAADRDNRIMAVPHDPAYPVLTAWDLGRRDSTVIWFAQQIGAQVRLIDHYAASSAGLDHYVKVLREKPYQYSTHILPHDVNVTELGTGKSRLDTLYSLGLKDIRVLPNLPRQDGIEAVRLMLPRCWFDAARCERGIEALRQYRREWDDERKTFKIDPLHDWTSDDADAFRYLAVGIQPAEMARLPQDRDYDRAKRTRRTVGWMAA